MTLCLLHLRRFGEISIFLFRIMIIIIGEARRPRLSRQTGFQPVSSPAFRFDTPNIRKTGVPACPGKQASSLFLIYPSVLTSQTTESHIIMTASRTIMEKFSRRFRDGHRFTFFFPRHYQNRFVISTSEKSG
jgi:hypothetical protein